MRTYEESVENALNLIAHLQVYQKELEKRHFLTQNYPIHVATDIVKFYELYHNLFEAFIVGYLGRTDYSEILEKRRSEIIGKTSIYKGFLTFTYDLVALVDLLSFQSRAVNVVLDDISKFLNNVLYIGRMTEATELNDD